MQLTLPSYPLPPTNPSHPPISPTPPIKPQTPLKSKLTAVESVRIVEEEVVVVRNLRQVARVEEAVAAVAVDPGQAVGKRGDEEPHAPRYHHAVVDHQDTRHRHGRKTHTFTKMKTFHSGFRDRRGCIFGGVMYLIVTRMPVGVTVGDSCLCCCVPCLSVAYISLRLLILRLKIRFGTGEG